MYVWCSSNSRFTGTVKQNINPICFFLVPKENQTSRPIWSQKYERHFQSKIRLVCPMLPKSAINSETGIGQRSVEWLFFIIISDVRRKSKIWHWMELWLCRNRVFICEEQLFGFPLQKQFFLLFNLCHYWIGILNFLFWSILNLFVQIHLIFECIQRNRCSKISSSSFPKTWSHVV